MSPAAVEACVAKVKAGWAKDPKSKPSKTKDGKPIKGDKDLESVAWAICEASKKHEDKLTSTMLEGIGPVLVGIAVTNRPHLPLPAMSVVERDGKEFIRVPFLRKGIFAHPDGELIFNDETFQRMLDNHKAKNPHYDVALDLRHDPKLGALAWFSDDKGGFIQQEDNVLVGYGVPVNDNAKEMVKTGVYKYASADFFPNYESNVKKLLSADDVRELSLEEFLSTQEDDMPKVNDDKSVTLTEAEFKEFEDLKKAHADLVAKVTKLEEAQPKQLELPEEARKLLDEVKAENASLRQARLEAVVEATMERARNRVADGRRHSPVLLEWADKVFRGQPLGTEGAIKLEQADNVGSVVKYVHDAVKFLLENLPGQVPVDTKTKGDKETKLEDGGDPNKKKYTKDDYGGFWGNQPEPVKED